jgi:protein-tyrosine phosphatase
MESWSPPADRYHRPIAAPRILFLCTANQCRSPMAEGLLRRLLEQRGIDAEVASAGLFDGGMPATATARQVLADRGIDVDGHTSRSLTDPSVDLAGADLVLAMERQHVREAAVAAPAAIDRILTLVDATRRAEAAAPRRPDESLAEWAARLGSGRRPSDAQGTGDDEIADPIGQPRARYEATADQLQELLERLVDRAWPPAEAGTGAA